MKLTREALLADTLKVWNAETVNDLPVDIRAKLDAAPETEPSYLSERARAALAQAAGNARAASAPSKKKSLWQKFLDRFGDELSKT